MRYNGKHDPIIITNVRDLGLLTVVMAAFGGFFLLPVGLSVTSPSVLACSCGGTTTTTLADRLSMGSAFGLFSLLFFLGCVALARMHRRVLQSVSEEDLCQRLGMDQETLQRWTQERQIKPRFLVIGRPHYELNDFGEAALLLRGCSSPTRAEELLRAGTMPDATPTDQLLHIPSDAQGSL
jgi:hypothetical protein